MGKNKMSFQNILNKDYHRSILFLLERYQNQKDDRGNIKKVGLRQIHFLYALMQKPKIYESSNKEIKEFFEGYDERNLVFGPQPNLLENLLQSGVLVRGCIKSPQKLNNYLTYLRKVQGLVAKKGRKPNVYYTLTRKYYAIKHQNNIISKIVNWNPCEMDDERHIYDYLKKPDFHHLEYKNIDDAPEFMSSFGRSWFLFGFTDKMIENLSHNKKNEFYRCLIEIEENLKKILDIKASMDKESQRNWKKNTVKEGKMIDTVYQKNLVFHYSGDFSIISKERLQMVQKMFLDFKDSKIYDPDKQQEVIRDINNFYKNSNN